MKNTIKWFGIIALVAIVGMALCLTSCEEKGGTLTVKNDSGVVIGFSVNAMTGLATNGSLKSGDSEKFTFDEDTSVDIPVSLFDEYGYKVKSFSKTVTVEKGEDVTVTVTYNEIK
jgi:hypothetical protein